MKLYRKIDLYDLQGNYIASTNWSKTLKEAENRAKGKLGRVIARFADE